MGHSWEEFKRDRLATGGAESQAAYRAGYERARRAFVMGEQIRALREAKGMTQEQLAKRAGTSQSAIARLEGGGAEPKLDTLERIGIALDASLVVRFEAQPQDGARQPA